MSSFASIDLGSLSTVSGGAGAKPVTTAGLLQAHYEKRFGINAKLIGQPKITDVLGPGLVSSSSRVDVNDQWGGDAKYKCSATVNTNGLGRVTNMRCTETSAQ
jgi:hypothetical protein